jgi:hypothetical protein
MGVEKKMRPYLSLNSYHRAIYTAQFAGRLKEE